MKFWHSKCYPKTQRDQITTFKKAVLVLALSVKSKLAIFKGYITSDDSKKSHSKKLWLVQS